jgi:glycosyltransferase involved in cell wall biosynthesis
MDITVIIPAYNEGEVIKSVINDLRAEGIDNLLVIDDGSSDETVKVLEKTGINFISHTVNKGYGASLKTGIRHAKTEYIAIYDGDGQHIPSELKKLMLEAEGYDMVSGARDASSFQVANRKLGKKVIKAFVNKITETEVPDFNSGLRIFKREVILKYLHLMPNGFSFSTTSTVTFLKLKYDVKYVPIYVKEREGRQSNITMKDGFRTLMLILNLSILFAPLKFFIPTSIFFMLSSFTYLVIYSILERVHVTSSMTMLFITGVIIFFMGILCEQISATRRELNG